MRPKSAVSVEPPVTEPAAAPAAEVVPAETLAAEAPVAPAPEESVIAEVEAVAPVESPGETPAAEAPPEPEPEPEPVAADSGDNRAPDVVEPVAEAVAEASGDATPVVEDVIADAAEAVAEEPPVEPVAAEIAADTVEAVADEVEADLTSAPSAPGAETDADAVAAPASEPAPAPAYAVDDSVLAILREEADREAKARAAEAQRLEMQPDLGVDAAASAKKKPALAVVPGDANAPETDAANGDIGLKTATRRDLLPDVEEINSTLRPSEVPADPDMPGAAAAAREQSGGFRTGFLTMMTIAILGAVVYIAAPTLSRLVPSLSDALAAYVGMVDSLRLSLDGMMQSATLAINGQ